jgi:hypothetical protein
MSKEQTENIHIQLPKQLSPKLYAKSIDHTFNTIEKINVAQLDFPPIQKLHYQQMSDLHQSLSLGHSAESFAESGSH